MQRHHFANKGLSGQSCGFSSSDALMWELDHKEGWVLKNWCFWIVVLDKTLESCSDCKEIKRVNPKGNQPWIFIGRTDADDETPVLCLPDVKSQVFGKVPDDGIDWGQEENGATEDEMVGWHHWLNGHEFEQTLGDSERQGSLACYSPWGHRVGHDLATEQFTICEQLRQWPKKLQFILFICSTSLSILNMILCLWGNKSTFQNRHSLCGEVWLLLRQLEA